VNEKVELSFVSFIGKVGDVESDGLGGEVVLYVRTVVDDVEDDTDEALNHSEPVGAELSVDSRLNGLPAIVVDRFFLLMELLKAITSHEGFF